MPEELIIVLIAMIPIAELKAAIPLAMVVFKMPAHEAFFWSVLGNTIPVLLVYSSGDYLFTKAEQRRGFLHRWVQKIAHRSRLFFTRRHEDLGLAALPLFVALPVPVAGAWTCAIGAFLFKVPLRKALPLILLGVEIGALLVILAVKGVIAAIEFGA